VAGQGGPGVNGGPNGDVYLRVSVADDPRFERQGDDLRTDVAVPLYTALLGGEALVNTLTGKVALTIPAETQSGKVFRLRGKGMPKRGSGKEFGDLLAKVSVILPTRLTDQERELLTELRSLRATS
jgi:DnaJ-class molecular chaperone